MKRVLVIYIIMFTMVFASTNKDIILYKIPNKDLKISAQTIVDGLILQGYTVSKNQDMNGPYEKQFKATLFNSYNLISVYHRDIAVKLIPKVPKSGIFTPFSIVTYQKKGEDDFFIAFLSAEAQQHILKVKDSYFNNLEKKTRETIIKTVPLAVEESLSYGSIVTEKPLYTEYSFDVKDKEAIEARDDMTMMMESDMKPSGFVVANYIDFNQVLNEEKVNDFIFYDAYSLCKLKIIYELSKKHPEAGAFAPCTMVIYHKKKSNKTKVVTLSIENLTSSLAIKDKTILKMLVKAQDTMKRIIEDSAE